MSRLIIKNIPAYVTPEKLREHFSQQKGPGGTLTDVQVPSRPEGGSRRFGFVGYKTEDEARMAQKWFNRTFFDSTRIAVEIVEQGARDALGPRPNKRRRIEEDDRRRVGHSKFERPLRHDNNGPFDRETRNESSLQRGQPARSGFDGRSDSRRAYEQEPRERVPRDEGVKRQRPEAPRLEPQTIKRRKDEEGIGETPDAKGVGRLDEFMKVMKPRTTKSRTWANEDPPIVSPAVPPTKSNKSSQPQGRQASPSDPDPTSPPDDAADDLAWMKSRMARGIHSTDADGDDKMFSQSSDEEVEEVESVLGIERPAKTDTRETTMETERLFLRNLSYTCTNDELSELFKTYGTVSQVHIPLDHPTKQSKGMAYVTFAQPDSALAALKALDKTTFQGRLLHILPAVDRRGPHAMEETGKTTLKENRLDQRKAGAGKEFNWSMLYMNADAVASSIADRMKISKADILNPDSDGADSNAAVKLALAETHIIQETKSYLEEQGVVLSAFGSRVRSDTVILVKNIPYGTDAEQLRDMFGEHGELRRVIVPPAGTMAVVEYFHSDDAARGFRAIAYRRLGNSIVYLEKAPMGIFLDAEPVPGKPTVLSAVKPVAIAEDHSPSGRADAKEDEPSAAAGSTLFVKNLAFATTKERLESTFRHLPGFAFARVQTKPDPQRPDGQSTLSMGYGFIGFKSVDDAKKAMRGLHGFVLDGHALVVKFAARGAEVEKKDAGTSKSRTTKMMVKNVPFEATKKDVRDLFGSYGHLKSVRMPKRFDARSRGFAFLEFVSRHEAENAYNALRHTHLLGRHLVLEWAEEDEDIETLRRKAGVGLGDGGEMPGRKRKLQFGNDEEAVADDVDA